MNVTPPSLFDLLPADAGVPTVAVAPGFAAVLQAATPLSPLAAPAVPLAATAATQAAAPVPDDAAWDTAVPDTAGAPPAQPVPAQPAPAIVLPIAAPNVAETPPPPVAALPPATAGSEAVPEPISRTVAAMPAEDADADTAPHRDDDAALAVALIVAPPPVTPRAAVLAEPAARALPVGARTRESPASAATAVSKPLPQRAPAVVDPVAPMVVARLPLALAQPRLPRETVPLPAAADAVTPRAPLAHATVGHAPVVVLAPPPPAALPTPALPEAPPPAVPLQPLDPAARVPERGPAAEQPVARTMRVPQPAAVPPVPAADSAAARRLTPVATVALAAAASPPLATPSPSVAAPPSRRTAPPLPTAAFDIAVAAPLTPTPLAAVAAPAPPRPAAPATPPALPIETEALGSIAIALDRRDAALHVHFTVDRPGAAQALLDSAGQLDGALQSGGTRLDLVSVDVRGGEARNQPGNSSNNGGGGAQSQSAPSDHGGQRPPPRGARAAPAAAPAPPRDARIATQDRFA